MAINKVEIKNSDGTKNILVDLTGDTVSTDTLSEGITAHGADGELITGTMKAGIDTSDATATPTDIRYNKTAYVKGEKITGDLRDAGNIAFSTFSEIKNYPSSNCIYVCGTKSSGSNSVCTNTTLGEAKAPYSEFGDAVASDVAKGKTFTSVAGLKVTGTATIGEGLDTSDATAVASDIVDGKTAYVNGKKVTGSIPHSSGSMTVTKNFGKNGNNFYYTYPETNAKRVIGDGASFTVNIAMSNFGDAIASDVAKGKTFTSSTGLKITGTAEPMVSNDNCEAYQITSASTALNFKRTDGTIKVWGYGYKQVSTYQKTVYAFCGDGYYTGTSYGTPTKTSVTWRLNSDGTLSGLPSGLTALDVLVTKGV